MAEILKTLSVVEIVLFRSTLFIGFFISGCLIYGKLMVHFVFAIGHFSYPWTDKGSNASISGPDGHAGPGIPESGETQCTVWGTSGK